MTDPTTPSPSPAAAEGPLPTSAIRLPKPPEPVQPSTPEAGDPGAPPLPRRERGATAKDPAEERAENEAMDLFGELEAEAPARSTLADFQRGQESARKEARG